MTAAPDWMKRHQVPARPTPAVVAGDTSLEYATELLSHISADCPYDEWRDMVFGIADKFGAAGYELARSWSAGAPHRFSDKAFDTLYAALESRLREAAEIFERQYGLPLVAFIIDTVAAAGMIPEDKENDLRHR